MIIENTGFVSRLRIISIASELSSIYLLDYRLAHYSDDLYKQFRIQIPSNLSAWVPQRRAQFLAGRLAASNALNSTSETTDMIGLVSGVQVLIGNHRQPIWPINFIGSISHSHQTSVAMVSKQHDDKVALGVDIQAIIDIETQSQIASTILTAQDTVLLKQSGVGLCKSALFTLTYSAKESFFKALFNTVGEYFDFDAVSLIGIDIESQQLTLRTNKRLGEQLDKGFEAKVTFVSLDDDPSRIITVCNSEL